MAVAFLELPPYKNVQGNGGKFKPHPSCCRPGSTKGSRGRALSKSSVSSVDSFKSSASRSRLSTGSAPGCRSPSGQVAKKSSPGRGSSQLPHKIGQSKRRSREMIKQLSSKQLEQQVSIDFPPFQKLLCFFNPLALRKMLPLNFLLFHDFRSNKTCRGHSHSDVVSPTPSQSSRVP